MKESMLFVRERRKRFCYSSCELNWFELGTCLLSLVIFIVKSDNFDSSINCGTS